MTASPTIEFWYDFASTYSYPAAMTLARRAANAGVAAVWRPMFVGALFHAQQGIADSPFNLHKQKGAFMWKDMERLCARLNLPLTRPTVFPRNSLPAARMALACEAEGLDVGVFSRAVYDASFARDLDISDPTVLGEIIAEIDYSGSDVLARAASPEIKAALKSQTDAAAAKGVFGAPTFTTLDGELFWGQDRLDEALDWAVSPSDPLIPANAGIHT